MALYDAIIEFGEIEFGWAEITVRHGDSDLRAVVSYVSDGLAEFITAVEQVATGRLSGAECRWWHEPGVWNVFVRARDTYPEVELTIIDPSDSSWVSVGQTGPIPAFRAVLDLRDLVRDVVSEYRALLDTYGAAGYELRWSYAFPHAQVDALSDWLDQEATRWTVPDGSGS